MLSFRQIRLIFVFLRQLQLRNLKQKGSIFRSFFESFIIMFLTIIQEGNYSSEATIQGRKLYEEILYYIIRIFNAIKCDAVLFCLKLPQNLKFACWWEQPFLREHWSLGLLRLKPSSDRTPRSVFCPFQKSRFSFEKCLRSVKFVSDLRINTMMFFRPAKIRYLTGIYFSKYKPRSSFEGRFNFIIGD